MQARAGGGRARAPLLPTTAQEAPSSEERALLQQLQEVTDRQRDELRAHHRDLRQRSQETEAVGTGRRVGTGLARPPSARPLTGPASGSAPSCRSSCNASCW